jgi:hypothetical protein
MLVSVSSEKITLCYLLWDVIKYRQIIFLEECSEFLNVIWLVVRLVLLIDFQLI